MGGPHLSRLGPVPLIVGLIGRPDHAPSGGRSFFRAKLPSATVSPHDLGASENVPWLAEIVLKEAGLRMVGETVSQTVVLSDSPKSVEFTGNERQVPAGHTRRGAGRSECLSPSPSVARAWRSGGRICVHSLGGAQPPAQLRFIEVRRAQPVGGNHLEPTAVGVGHGLGI